MFGGHVNTSTHAVQSSVISLFHGKPAQYWSYMVEKSSLCIMVLSLYHSRELFDNHGSHLSIYIYILKKPQKTQKTTTCFNVFSPF